MARRKNIIPYDPQSGERQELKRLDEELADIMKNDFPGRVYTQCTNEKIKRLEYLKKKFPFTAKEIKTIGINPLP
jgi:hypothetical protein